MPEPQNDNERDDAVRGASPDEPMDTPGERLPAPERRGHAENVLGDADDASAPQGDPGQHELTPGEQHDLTSGEQTDAVQGERTDPIQGEHGDAVPAASGARDDSVQYGVGPFSIREVALGGVWLVAFVVSFFSILPGRTDFTSVWSEGINWILSIAVPTVAVFLIVLRRLSPTGIRRVGSLGIDQFASVAFSVAAVSWITLAWESVVVSLRYSASSGYSWVVWVESILMLAGVVLTVFAPLIPVFARDFQGRPEQGAHRFARPVTAVAPRPRPVRPVPAAAEPQPASDAPQSPVADDQAHDEARVDARVDGDASPAVAGAPEPAADVHTETTVLDAAPSDPRTTVVPNVSQAFWALVPEERAVVDASGNALFFVGPTAWALVIEERGDLFVVRHEDGRVGYLRDVSGVTRG